MKPILFLLLCGLWATPAGVLIAAPGTARTQPRTELANQPPATGGIRLRFRGASLDLVLDYLGEAAGFTIVRETQPRGTVNFWSDQPVTRDEAFDLLNSALMNNGFAAIRQGRKLTIVNRDEAKTQPVPVTLGSDPKSIPGTQEIVTLIIPVRFTEAGPLIKDLQALVSTRTAMTANESANAIIITDTQANIRKVAAILRAIDAGAEDPTAVRVFHLANADPAETVDLLSQLFPDQNRSDNNQTPVQFGGGFPGPAGPPVESEGQGAANSRLKKGAKVVAVADPRTASVVVSAPEDLIAQVEAVVRQLDRNPARKEHVAVFQFKNASAQQAVKVLQDLFQKSSASSTRTPSSQTDPLETRRTTQTQNQPGNSGSRSSLAGASGGLSGAGAGGGGAGLLP
jgi:general secretion pathway protein D